MGQETPQTHLGRTDGPFWLTVTEDLFWLNCDRGFIWFNGGHRSFLLQNRLPRDMPSVCSGFQILFLTPYWYIFVRVIFGSFFLYNSTSLLLSWVHQSNPTSSLELCFGPFQGLLNPSRWFGAHCPKLAENKDMVGQQRKFPKPQQLGCDGLQGAVH